SPVRTPPLSTRFPYTTLFRSPRVEPAQQRGQARVAAGGRAPVDVHGGNVERGEREREEVETDVDDARCCAEQRHQRAPARRAIAAASRAAWAFPSITMTPASRSVAI